MLESEKVWESWEDWGPRRERVHFGDGGVHRLRHHQLMTPALPWYLAPLAANHSSRR